MRGTIYARGRADDSTVGRRLLLKLILEQLAARIAVSLAQLPNRRVGPAPPQGLETLAERGPGAGGKSRNLGRPERRFRRVSPRDVQDRRRGIEWARGEIA